jgi:hypothetical protein
MGMRNAEHGIGMVAEHWEHEMGMVVEHWEWKNREWWQNTEWQTTLTALISSIYIYLKKSQDFLLIVSALRIIFFYLTN